jgi:hypothetical protein
VRQAIEIKQSMSLFSPLLQSMRAYTRTPGIPRVD